MISQFSPKKLTISSAVRSSPGIFQIGDVKGCDGFTLLAHSKTFRNKGRLYAPRLGFSGSLYKDQNRIRSSSLNVPTTSLIYFSIEPHLVESFTTSAPGDCTQPELCTPGISGSCLPNWGILASSKVPLVKKVTITLISCLSAIPKTLSNLSLKASGFSSHTRLCKKIRTVLNPIPCAHPSSLSIVSRSNVSSCHISI